MVKDEGAVGGEAAPGLADGAAAEEVPPEVQYWHPARRNSGTFTNPQPALLRPASPRSELATAGMTAPLLVVHSK